MKLRIYGSIILNGKEFKNESIMNLSHEDISGWKFGHIQDDGKIIISDIELDGGNICISDEDSENDPIIFFDLAFLIPFLKEWKRLGIEILPID
jgi:hypothetical protein